MDVLLNFGKSVLLSDSFCNLRDKMFELRSRFEDRGDHMFLGIPDFWYESHGPKYRCPNDHVSHVILLSETGDLCMFVMSLFL